MGQLILNRWEDPYYIDSLGNSKTVLSRVAQLINCSVSALEEAIRLRRSEGEMICSGDETGIDRSNIFHAGYHQFLIPKSDGTSRTISEPAPTLKIVQREIKDVLLGQVETYSRAIGGERGKSFIDNTRIHSPNSSGYLVNMDLASAYPSVDARRIFVNLREALRKKIDISFGNISDEDREKIIDFIVILITYNGSLPQGASTSMKVLNIVMAKSDQRIVQLLGEIGLHTPIYTRYVDDLSISWREFSDMMPIWRLRANTLRTLKSLGEQNGAPTTDSITNFSDELRTTLDQLSQTTFQFHTREQRRYLVSFLDTLSQRVDDFTNFAQNNSSEALVDQLNTLKTKIKELKYRFAQEEKIHDGVGLVRDKVRKVLIAEGWEVKDSKTRLWTPASREEKVITGVTLSKAGVLGIPGKKEKEIRDFLDRALHYPETLPLSYRNNQKKIAETIVGYKNYILQVRGKLNSDLAKLFRQCKEIYFPDGSDIARDLGYAGFWYNGV